MAGTGGYADRGNRKPWKPKYDIIFSAGIVAKENDKIQISVNMQVSKDGINQTGRQIEVLFAGKSVFTSPETDASGRASGEFAIAAKAGEQTELTAVLLGSDNVSRVIRVNIPDEIKPKIRQATKADIEEKGKDGCYVIIGQTLDANGVGVKSKFLFTEALGKSEKSILMNCGEQETEEDGTIKVMLHNFTENRRTIDVRVAGTSLEKTLILEGPKKTALKPIKGGFLANVRNAVRKNRRNK